MLVLAIDTTAKLGGFAVARDGEIVTSRTAEPEDGLAGALFGEIEALLAAAECNLEDFDAFAALSGPGSFTGIRVGLSAVKALSEASDKPAHAISNLEALAFAGEGPVRAAVLPGRRGDVFGAVYDANLRALVTERVEPAETFFARALELGARWTTADARLALPQGVAAQVIAPLAEAAARLACRRPGVPPEAADANYVERPAVEKPKRRPEPSSRN